MILVASPTARFHSQCAVRFHRLYHRSREISAVDLCKPWPTTDRCKLWTQEKLWLKERCLVRRRPKTAATAMEEENDSVRKFIRYLLWTTEAVYILWLFLLPYAPGDPIWAISSKTVKSLVGLSLNFFFILPLSNSVGIHFLESPLLHPMEEGLFNFVVAWTLMFAPLLYTDRKRDRYRNSLDVLWGLMMFLTNTFLIPYMAIRLSDADPDAKPSPRSRLGDIMTKGSAIVGLTGASVCLISVLWGVYGRADGGFGDVTDRWQYVIGYIGSERLAYAFIWDICLYTIFQPWLIGENLQNVKNDMAPLMKFLRFVPVVGLVAYLLFLDVDEENV